MPVSQPDVEVVIGGVAIPAAKSIEVIQVGYFAADRFIIEFAIGASLQANAAYFSTLGATGLTVGVAQFAGGFRSLLTGKIDHIALDMGKNTATLSGRDLSGDLIDAEISEAFANQTASQIATTIASRHGLTPNVTATMTPVGQYYNLDYARSGLGLNSRSGTEWNLLCWLALAQGFDLSVTGTTLNFGPSVPANSLSLSPQSCIELNIDTICAIPALTQVKSWNTRGKSVVTQAAGSGSGSTATLIRPNLTTQQATRYAQDHQANINLHRTRMFATIPGETSLTPGSIIDLTQTNSSFDQSYMVDSIIRSIDSARGFTQVVCAHAIS